MAPVPGISRECAAMTDDPVVVGLPRGGVLVITCPWCGQTHYHGRGPGHRVAHCIQPVGGRRGYEIREGP